MQIPYTFVVPGLIFNPEEGKYAWNSDCDTPSAKRLKMLIEGAKQRNMKLAFTFVVDSRDKHYNFTPNFCKRGWRERI